MKHVLALIFFSFAIRYSANAALFGTRTVGPSGDYPSLTGAIAEVQAQSLGGALVLELQATYIGTVETFPLTIPALNGASAVNTLTIRPASGATALAISSANTTAATIDLNGAKFVTIDGRPGGVGSNAGSGGGAASQLTIANTSTSGVAVRFINEASSNTLRYTTFRGVNTSATSGTVLFSTTTGANGNDNNTLEHCDVRDGASTPANSLYSVGSTGTPAQNNSGNTISNCNIFNFYAATAVDAAGARLDGGNTDWTITGNSFYQTASRAAVAANIRPIFVNNTSGNNFTVTGNSIGGSAPNAIGTAWTTTGTTVAYWFQGIRLNVGTTTPSSVNGNTIANIVWTGSSVFNTSPGIWSGIYVTAGAANIGTTTGNTIGSGSGTGSISVTSGGPEGMTFGIGSTSSGAVAIANNTIGSMTTNGLGEPSLIGVQVTGGANTISNNLVGSLITPNSLNAAAASTAGNSGPRVVGIESASSSGASITSNTVANLNNNYAGTYPSQQIRGIATSAGVNTVTGNTVRNLSTTSPNSSADTSASVVGISQSAFAAGQTVSQNVVHSLSNTAASAGVHVYGIYYSASATAGNVVARNFVHSLSIASTSTISSLRGMHFDAGSFTAQNNMVRVGLAASGANTAGGSALSGILDNGTSAGRNFYHNSVFVGGTQTIVSNFTHAFSSAGSANTRDFRNNIFVNTRTGGTHFAVYFSVSNSLTGLRADNNLFFAAGTGAVLGNYNFADRTTLAAWQTATGLDAASIVADPLFINPTGNAATGNLHVQSSSPTSGLGAPLAAVTDDFDGQPRSPVSPDIGSDEFAAAAIGVEQPAGTSLLDGNSTVSFGWVPNGTPLAKTFIIRNTGEASLTVGAINKDGTDAGLFTMDATGVGSTLAPGGTFTFTVTFTPNVTGNKTAALHIASSDPNRNPFDIALAGIGFTGLPLSGTKTIGPTGYYSNIGNAILDVQGSGFGGPLVLELQPGYSSTVENFPLTFTDLTGTTVNTLTLRPQTGATGLAITSANTTAATVDLNGAKFVIIDGRPGGTGTAKQLTIANTATGGVAVRFINEASNNTLSYLTLQSVNTSATSGTVVFHTTTGANGNDNNTIDHCDIRAGSTTPAKAIYSLGSIDTPAMQNSGNSVSNCNILNFYSTSSESAGVWLGSGNTEWTISGNSFYQTASRAPVQFEGAFPISIVNTAGNNFTVSGNFIGGSAPNAGGTPWTLGTTNSYEFTGIYLRVGTITPSNIQGNVIRNINWLRSSAWTGIGVGDGSVNVGTVTGNTIGSATGTGSIAVTAALTPHTTIGIAAETTGTVAIANNTIGSLTASGFSDSSLIGIQVGLGTYTIANNTVGSNTTANSLNAASSVNAAQQVIGINVVEVLSGSGSANITGNTVANLNNNVTGTVTGAQISGIATADGVNTISGNIVRNLSTTSQNSFSASALGISLSSSEAGQTISQNIVHSLANTAASANVTVTGISYAGGATTRPNLIERNLVHSLAVSSTGTGSQVNGMQFAAGTFTAQNNMVRVGLKADAASTANAGTVRGIYDNGGTAGRNFYHNSIIVGGTQTSGGNNTQAFLSIGTTNLRDFRNNIFVNARSNSGGTGKHYAVAYGGTTGNPAGLTANNDIFFVSGTGGVLGSYNGADRTTLAAWQTATGVDTASLNGNPLYLNSSGTFATVDLHVQAGSLVESAGTPVASAMDDFDGQARSALSPVDIGADAGDFGFGISYPLLGIGTTANRMLSGWAGIISASGISGGANAPRFYFKKSTDADVFGAANDSTGNGWKYVAANNGSSPYSFTVDHSLLTGGGVSVGDTIQYFVVAQDTAGNFKSNPIGAVTTGNSVQNLSAKPTTGVNSYTIVNTIGGTVTVGPGGTFTSLSGAGGLFAALNSRMLTGNLTVNLTGNPAENGSTVLNALTSNNGYPLANAFAVTIQPDSATMRTISGAAASGLIRLNGVQRVTFDGSFGGAGRYLTFRNTNTGGATVVFINDASNNTVRNCVIEGAATDANVGAVLFSTGAITGNDNNTVTGCQIRNRSDATGVPASLVVSFGSWDTLSNSNNTISNNELFNFTANGVNVASASDSWTIAGNTIFQTASRTTNLHGIAFNAVGTNTIRGNFVHDLPTSGTAFGIDLSAQTGAMTVAGNRIYLGNPGGAGGIVFSPGVGQSVTVLNNMVTLSPAGDTPYRLWGIQDSGASGSTILIVHNTVLITGANTDPIQSTRAFSRVGTSTATVKNNIFLNLRTRTGAGSGDNFPANHYTLSTGTLDMDYNIYTGTGLNETLDFFDGGDGTDNLTHPITYAQWQINVPSDRHSSAGPPGGNFTSAMFVNAATGDLRLVPGGNVLVNNTGTPVPGVTTDYDGQTRSGTTPDIGADELITNANLSGLALSSGTLSPAFNPGTVNYTAVVSNATTTLIVMPTVADPDATVTVHSTSPATPVALNVAANPIPILVTAQDGTTTKPYTVVITRQTAFQDWAGANGVASDPNATGANGLANLLNFAFGIHPVTGGSGELQYAGTLAGGGTIAATGLPRRWMEPSGIGVDFRALFVRRKNYVAAGLTYTPQFSADLITWVNSTVMPAVLADDGVNQIVSVPYPAFLAGKKARFFRISATLAP